MGDASFNKGGVATRNLKAGSATTDASGNDVSVDFDRPMKNEPEVVATAQSGAEAYVVSKSQTGFTLGTDAGSETSFSWIAFNDDRA